MHLPKRPIALFRGHIHEGARSWVSNGRRIRAWEGGRDFSATQCRPTRIPLCNGVYASANRTADTHARANAAKRTTNPTGSTCSHRCWRCQVPKAAGHAPSNTEPDRQENLGQEVIPPKGVLRVPTALPCKASLSSLLALSVFRR